MAVPGPHGLVGVAIVAGGAEDRLDLRRGDQVAFHGRVAALHRHELDDDTGHGQEAQGPGPDFRFFHSTRAPLINE